MRFQFQSSSPALLNKADAIAQRFLTQYATDEIVGIVLLGAVARGYFDAAADIDIALFRAAGAQIQIPQYQHVDGIEVHSHLADYDEELAASWSMPKRWTFSQGKVAFDPDGRVARLLQDKVPLQPDERKWLMMSGLALSEWYANRLSELWVERGNLTSAHHMFVQGLDYFLDMLFGLNDELVADMKWKYYCAEGLARLPSRFRERAQETMTLSTFTTEELARRRAAFMVMWEEMLPVVEQEVGMSFAQIMEIV